MARITELDTWQEIGETLRRNPVRTALTGLGVFWGMFMLVAMVGFGTGLQRGVERRFEGEATNAVYLWGGRSTMPYQGRQPGRRIAFRMDDAEALQAQVEGIQYFAPRAQLGGWRDGNEVRHDGNIGNYAVMGDTPDYAAIQPMVFGGGRFIHDTDMAERRKVAVIGERVVEELFGLGVDPVGAQIEVQGVRFTVVGWYRSPRADDRGDRLASTVNVPLTTFQQAFNYGDRIGWLAMTGQADVSGEDLERQARAVLATRHGLHPEDEPAIGSNNAELEFARVRNTFAGIQALVWFVGTMTLLGGIVGVANIMLVTVRERTREIGVRRVLGAERRTIMRQVLAESVVLTGLAGYLGLVAGVALLQGISAVVGADHDVLGNPQVGPEVVLVAAVALTLAGLFAGWFPANRAAAIQPVEALRAE